MQTALRIFLVLLLFAVTVFFNLGLVDIRMEEVGSLLESVAQQQDVSKSLGIVAKYELIKRRMLYGEENTANYELEARIQALTSGNVREDKRAAVHAKFYAGPVRLAVNGMRLLLGKKIINAKSDDNVFKVLEIGYFWERNRKYGEAIRIYNEVLDKSDGSPEIRAAVMVHKAFCHSMLSEYDVAKKVYENIISAYPNTEAGIVSWKLIDFLESIARERAKVERPDASSFEKGKQFYLLMDYRNAIKDFSLFLTQKPKQETIPEARFYKGRAHEELGEIEEAMAEYNAVIKDDVSMRWGKQANRRMLMLGEFYESKKQIADEARKRLEAYQDKLFVDKVQQYTSLVSESSLRGELLKEGGVQAGRRDSKSDSMLSFINNIGDLDLSGEKARQKQDEIEKMKNELIASGNLSTAQVREIERKSALAQNPYRKPSAIKDIIDQNSNEVQYLYNKKLRLGLKLAGRMLVKIQIHPDGSVAGANVVQSNLGDQDFEKEVLGRISQWKFKGVPDSLGDLTVNYPFEFTKEE